MGEALAVVGVQVHSGVERETLGVGGLLLDSRGIGKIAAEEGERVGLGGGQPIRWWALRASPRSVEGTHAA